MSLRAKTAKGFAFESLKTVTTSVVSTVRMMILARLLAPGAFGLFALALALITGLETMTNVNIDKYLIQRKELEPDLIGCAWLMGIARGIFTCAATLLFAPFYGHLTKQPAAVEVLYIVAFVSLIRGFRSPGGIWAERSLNYLKLNSFDVCIDLLETSVVVILAFFINNATALAWSMLSATVASVAASYLVFGFGAKICFDWKRFRELIGVGKHFVVISIFSYVMIQGDNLTVGALLGTTMLGYYVIAYRLVDLPLRLTFQVTNRVGFNALSRLQHDPERMRERFLELFDLQTAILFPVIVAIVILAEPLVLTLFGANWAQSVPVVRALGLIMVGRGLSLIVVPFVMATAGYSFISKVKVIETLLFFLGVIVGAKTAGLVGVALGGGVGYAVAAAVRLGYLIVVGQIGARLLIRHFQTVLLTLAAPVILVTLFLQTVRVSGAAGLMLAGCIFFVSYMAMMLLLRPDFLRQIKQTTLIFIRPTPIPVAGAD